MGWSAEDEAKYQAALQAKQQPGLESLIKGGLPSGADLGAGSPAEEGQAQGAGLDFAKQVLTPKPQSMSQEQRMSPPQWTSRHTEGLLGAVPISGATSALKDVAERTGISQIPDILMQSAVGIKKQVPGVGSELLKQGVWGTARGMESKIADKIPELGEKLSQAVQAIPGEIESGPIADKISETIRKYVTPGGQTTQEAQPLIDRIQSVADDITSRGSTSPTEALGFKRIAQGVGYKEGTPLAGLGSKLAQKEAGAYGEQLEKAWGERVGGETNPVAESNKGLHALLTGQKALQKPDATVGIGSMLKSLAPTSLMESGAAKGLSEAGQAATSPMAQGLARTAMERASEPEPNNATVGKGDVGHVVGMSNSKAIDSDQTHTNPKAAWSPEDEAKYQAALKQQAR